LHLHKWLNCLTENYPSFVISGEDDFKPGSILEVEVRNFMTYDHVKTKPGPRLNLVIGPNGTGKSSIVCAIGIGLAGEPQVLLFGQLLSLLVHLGARKFYVNT
jgi:hypothetical protein